VDCSILFTSIELVGDDLLPVSVCEEIDAAGWDDSNECRPQSFKQRGDAFVSKYISANAYENQYRLK
jgi:hypothetical protein